nr:immunoglobulin heavy chain junction region [Mus musculus]
CARHWDVWYFDVW